MFFQQSIQSIITFSRAELPTAPLHDTHPCMTGAEAGKLPEDIRISKYREFQRTYATISNDKFRQYIHLLIGGNINWSNLIIK